MGDACFLLAPDRTNNVNMMFTHLCTAQLPYTVAHANPTSHSQAQRSSQIHLAKVHLVVTTAMLARWRLLKRSRCHRARREHAA